MITIEDGGRVLRGLAVPYDQPTIILDQHELIAEMFDRQSIVAVEDGAPLLVSHLRDREPLGRIVSHRHTGDGLEIEARLIDSESELERWRTRWAENLMTGLSVGFRQGPGQWERPPQRGMPPLKRVREVEVVEVSAVNWPAYPNAGLRGLAQRTAAAEEAQQRRDELRKRNEQTLHEITMGQIERQIRRGR